MKLMNEENQEENFSEQPYTEENLYKERRNIKAKRQRLVFVFFTTFAVVFFTCLSIASMLTPDIDIPALKDEEELSAMGSTDFKGRVDPRLRLLEMQENGTPLSPEDKMALNDEFTQLAKQNAAVIKPIELEEDNAENTDKNKQSFADVDLFANEPKDFKFADLKPENAPKPKISDINKDKEPDVPLLPSIKKEEVELRSQVSTAPKRYEMVKVLVGSYNTPAEARRASRQLSGAHLPITPFIKEIDGMYTLQVGSYSSVSQATELADELRSQNLSVKLIQE